MKLIATNPALGKPTIPIFRLVPTRPINGLGFASSFFFGGIILSEKKMKQSEIKYFIYQNTDIQ